MTCIYDLNNFWKITKYVPPWDMVQQKCTPMGYKRGTFEGTFVIQGTHNMCISKLNKVIEHVKVGAFTI